MMSKVSIRNYKSLRDVQVGLERFTVFVGPNASGKSSILQGIDWLCRMFHLGQPEGTDGDLRRGLSQGVTGPIELTAMVGDSAYRYRTRPTSLHSMPGGPRAVWDGNGRGVAAKLDASDWKEWKPVSTGSNPLPLSALLRLETPKLLNPAHASDPTTMSPDGSGLHAALATMALNDPDAWQELQANLRRIIPTIRRLRHTKAPTIQQSPSLLFDTLRADSLPADQVSEGTLLVLGLLAALHAPGRPSLILLDDLDRGLHPKAQKELIALLRSMQKTNPELQIIATTHSPYMLDSMNVDEVRMTLLRDDGSTACAALAEHPKFPRWKDEMTPGEMWGLFGEKWVAEEVPA